MSIFGSNNSVKLYFFPWATESVFKLFLTAQLGCAQHHPLLLERSAYLSESANTHTLSHTHTHTFNLIQRQTPCCSNLMEPSARSQTGSSCSHGLIPAAEPWHGERQTIWPPSHSHSSGSQQGRQLGVGVCMNAWQRERGRERSLSVSAF